MRAVGFLSYARMSNNAKLPKGGGVGVAGGAIRGQLVKSGFYCLTVAHQMKQMENAHNTATGVTSGKCGKIGGRADRTSFPHKFARLFLHK